MANVTLISVIVTILIIFGAMIFAGTLYSSHLVKVKDSHGGLNENSAAFEARQLDQKKSESIPAADAVKADAALLKGDAKGSKADVGGSDASEVPSYKQVIAPGAEDDSDTAADDAADDEGDTKEDAADNEGDTEEDAADDSEDADDKNAADAQDE